MQKNRIKEKMFTGHPAFGVSLMFPAPQVVEMLGRLGFDWILIDCEHGIFSPESIQHMVLAAEVIGLTPIVRPASNSAEAIAQVLDCGALGVQVPHINTVEEARRVVEAVKFYPEGQRGLAASTRPSGYGFDGSMSEYVLSANRETLVCIQLEEPVALDNIQQLVQVAGIDVLFVGPSDLSQSLGVPGQTDAPQVVDAMQQAFKVVVEVGKLAGSAGNAQATSRYLHADVRYLYTHLTTLLAQGSQEFFRGVQ